MLINVDINGLNVQFQLWDTAGQERFFSICRNTYQSILCDYLVADMIIVVFDATKKTHPHDYYDSKIEENCKEDIKKLYVVNMIDKNPSIKRKEGHYYLSCKTN
jgi:small GTP-binding protein